MNSMSSSIPRSSHYEEDSFIILGSTSPKTSMENAMIESKILQNSKGSDLFKMSNSVMKSGSELDDESVLYRAHFNLEQVRINQLQKQFLTFHLRLHIDQFFEFLFPLIYITILKKNASSDMNGCIISLQSFRNMLNSFIPKIYLIFPLLHR